VNLRRVRASVIAFLLLSWTGSPGSLIVARLVSRGSAPEHGLPSALSADKAAGIDVDQSGLGRTDRYRNVLASGAIPAFTPRTSGESAHKIDSQWENPTAHSVSFWL
jgi:hypothetical protein